MNDWKSFLLKYKWMPSSILIDKFDLKKYDIDNFKRKLKIKRILEPWKISLNQQPDRLRAIFSDAWKYYLTEVCNVDLTTPKKNWVQKLLSLKNVSRKGSGFSFLTNSKYLNIICPKNLEEYRIHGFTNIALGTFQFWPGKSFLSGQGIMPFMFYQTHKSALDKINIEDMIEHVYLSFLSTQNGDDKQFAKELFFARHDETGFITSKELAKYGIPKNFYNDRGGLRLMLSRIADKYALELGYLDYPDLSWSSSEFRNKYPDKKLDHCKYCGLSPVDLHHLLPRSDYPSLIYHAENVIPLCIQVHGLITRKHWSKEQRGKYESAISKWHKAKERRKSSVFDEVMNEFHNFIYGYVEKT